MIRRAVAVALIVTGLLAPLSAAGGAGASSGTGGGSGCNGNSCAILLSRLITLGGDVGNGAGFPPLPLAPPACLWEQIGNAVTGSEYIVMNYGGAPPNAFFGLFASVQQAKKLLQANAPASAGTWFMLPINPGSSLAAQAACRRQPLFVFVAPGQPLPALPIPPRTLAEYAYNHMLIPRPAITTSPPAVGYVNLGTYVWGNWAASRTTGRMNAYKITATLGAETVTVWAQASGFTVNVTGPGTPYSGGCGPAGSHFPVGRAPAGAGPGVPPDCGVLWQAPVTGATLTATVRWAVSWGNGDLDGPGNNPLPAIPVTGPAPPHRVPVREIQSVNGG
jgi:hypothetical protein